MGKTTNLIGSKIPPTENKKIQEKVEDVHIAVFFDGTNNNAVQKAFYNDSLLNRLRKEKNKKKGENDDKAKVNPFEDSLTFKDVTRLEDEIAGLEFQKNLLLYSQGHDGGYSSDLYDLNEEIRKKRECLEKINVHPEFKAEDLSLDVKQHGYSNVAILYGLFDTDTKDSPSIRKHFYIEGAGANDISGKQIGSEIKMNINGLGFGLGVTGVTALVSKAVTYITHYVNSIKSKFDDNTRLKFYVFGFSRGATCARLFTHLLTRGIGDLLPKREHEFSYYCTAPIFSGNRINFLEDYKKSNRIKVEFLGIYDTVASIGFLKQKDGFHDPLRATYAKMPNYKDNWHYRNVTEYGLYISDDKEKLANVCHIGALDEFRENFAFTNLGKTVPSNALEILIPGCHSDVGGGYIDEDSSQEMILHKTTKKNHSSAEQSSDSKLPTYITFNPQKKDERQLLSLKSLEELGWIESEGAAKARKKSHNNSPTYTLRAIEHDNIVLKHVKFKRSTKRGYSDIPLQMMIKCCDELCKLKVFQQYKPQEYDYTKRADLEKLGNEIISHVTKPSGKRIWIVPKDGYSGVKYRNLRLKYLHFTSTGRIAHINWGKSVIEGSPGNIGNKPNFDLNGTLCRITYDGDKKHGFNETSYETEVKYLYDLESYETKEVECDVNINE